MVEVKFYDTVNDELLKFAVIISQSNGKWVFCKHKERDTYEVPGGHREAGEDILETAKRELQEETGAIKFEIKPICVYSVTGKTRVNDTGEETFGLLCFAEITEFAKELHSEMEKVVLMDELPENWTYPLIQPKLIEEWERREKGEMQMRILVIGGTPDSYGDKVERITIQRTNEESIREALQGKHFDVVIDKIAYCSNDIRYVSLLLLSSLFNVSLDQLIKGDIEKMKEIISEQEIKKFNYYGSIYTVHLAVLIISAVPLFMWLGRYAYIPFGILFIITKYWALKVEKLKKKNDIQTYKEIVAFTEGKKLDELHKAVEVGKRPYGSVIWSVGLR